MSAPLGIDHVQLAMPEGGEECRCSALMSDAPAKSKGPRTKRGGGMSLKKKKKENDRGGSGASSDRSEVGALTAAEAGSASSVDAAGIGTVRV